MRYWGSEKEVRVGDHVLYAGSPARIVFIVDDDSFSDRYPRQHWADYGKGFGVELQDETRTLYFLDTSEEEEDLEFVGKREEE